MKKPDHSFHNSEHSAIKKNDSDSSDNSMSDYNINNFNEEMEKDQTTKEEVKTEYGSAVNKLYP